MDASKKAVQEGAELCAAERKTLIRDLKVSLENDYSENSSSKLNFTHAWELIHGVIIKV